MLAAPTWFIATDADDSGDRAAEDWPARARRVRPTSPFKDWTEARPGAWRCSVSGTDAEASCVVQPGIDLRRWWIEEVLPLDGPFAIEERAAIQESSRP
jgi:hypothetical protein